MVGGMENAMKAIVRDAYGSVDVLRLAEIDTPVAGGSEVDDDERAFLPFKRSCICSNCCREMPTRTGCQRQRGGKSKNAATLPSRR